jgi:predicted lactoylglutathione lyase
MKNMPSLTTILPCSDLGTSEHFYRRLGFLRHHEDLCAETRDDSYCILHDADGADLHLRRAEPGWLVPGQNPLSLYYMHEDVDQLAAEFAGEIIGTDWPEDKAWGMYEFAVSDPDATLIRIGWPTRLRRQSIIEG